jgi:hypothetical protein
MLPQSEHARHTTREKTTLCDTEASTSSKEAVVILDETHGCAAYSPRNHDRWDPETRTSLLLGEALAGSEARKCQRLTYNFSQDVEREEDSESNLKFC